MAATLDQIDAVRLLIADPSGTDPLLTDQQIDTLVDLAGGSVHLAAAQALEAIAVSEVLVSKKIRTQSLSTDGPAVSAELRALANRLRATAQAAADLADTFDGFDLVDTLGGPDGCAPELTPRFFTGM